MDDLIDDGGEAVPSAEEMIKMRREIREAELAAQRQTITGDIKIAMGGAMSAELEKCMLQGQSLANRSSMHCTELPRC